MELVLASGNQGKLRELAAMLADTPLVVRAQSEFDLAEVAETGTTFVENAIIKARHASALTGLPALADDSGLAVAALGGAPGVHSARYAGNVASDADNIAKLLDAMREVPNAGRECCFVCVMVYLRHAADPLPLIAHGLWHGRLLTHPRGDGGFGYDPVFCVSERGCSAAQLEPGVKNEISHRGQALRTLVAALKRELAGA